MKVMEREQIRDFWKGVLKTPGKVSEDLRNGFVADSKRYKRAYKNWRKDIPTT